MIAGSAPASFVPSESSSASGLPDAPGAAPLRGYVMAPNPVTPGSNVAPKYSTHIASDETAQTLTTGDKIVMNLRDLYAPTHFGSAILAAGWSHINNGAPNYGTDRGAFGERLGAAELHATSERVFEKVILVPAFHIDARYYVMGSNHNIGQRGLYALSRIVVTKTDSGHNTFNAPLFIGQAGAAALNRTYYPPINRNFHDAASEFASSFTGTALGFVVDEFSDGLLRAIHMKKKK